MTMTADGLRGWVGSNYPRWVGSNPPGWVIHPSASEGGGICDKDIGIAELEKANNEEKAQAVVKSKTELPTQHLGNSPSNSEQ